MNGLPRPIEALAALVAVVLAAPLLALVALAVASTSRGGVFFRQTRVGRHGMPFTLLKFRTMRPSDGPRVTAGGDPRITPIGRLLRRTKLDELPELVNILRGEMSFVGPRPEVPDYVDLNDPFWQRVLTARPGLTDPMTLRLRDEESLLARVEDPPRFYREKLVPFKLRGYARYLEERTAWSDLVVLGRTVAVVLRLGRVDPPTLEEIEGRPNVTARHRNQVH